MPKDNPGLLNRLFSGSSTKSHPTRTVNPVQSWFQGWSRNYDPTYFEATDDGLQRAYLASLWAYRCISLRGKRLSAVPLVVKSHDDNYPDRRGRLHDKPVTQQVNQHILQRFVGPGSTRVWRTLEYDLCIWGRGFILPTKRGLFRLNPSTIEVLKSAENGIDGFRQIIGGATISEWTPDQLVYIYDYDPTDDVGSISPLAFALRQVGAEVSVGEFVEGFFANDATPAGLLTSDKPLTDSDIQSTVAWWTKLFGGIGNKGKIGVVGHGITFQQLTSTMEDLAIASVRLEIRREICAAFGVPMTIALADEAANFSTSEQQYVAFYTETILPEIDMILDTLNEQLVPKFDPTGTLKIEADTSRIKPLQEDAAELTTRAVAGFGGSIMTWNESRQMQDLRPTDQDYVNLPNVGMVRVEDIPVIAARNLRNALGETTNGDPIPERDNLATALAYEAKPIGGGKGPTTGGAGGPGGLGKPGVLPTPVEEDATSTLEHLTSDWITGTLERAQATEQEAQKPDLGEQPDHAGGGQRPPSAPKAPNVQRNPPPQLVIPTEARPTGVQWRPGGRQTKSVDDATDLYVSIPLPGHPAIRALQDALKRQVGGDVQWQDPDTFHVTLCYANGVPDDELSTIVHNIKPLGVMLRGGQLATFPVNPEQSDGRPLIIKLDPTSALAEFQRRVHAATAAHSQSVSEFSDPNNFHPHITLGYLPAGSTYEPPVTRFAMTIPVGKVEFSRPDYQVVGQLSADATEVQPPIQKSLALTELRQWRKKALGKGAQKHFSSLAIPRATKMFLQWDLAEAKDEAAVKSAFDKAIHTLESRDPTPEEFEEYWEGLDDVTTGLVDTLGDILGDENLKKAVGDEIERTGGTDTLDRFFDERAKELVDRLIGTEDAPGPLTQIFLAGAVRGQKIHDRLSAAVQRAQKAVPGRVEVSSAWQLLHKDARQAARTAAYDLVRGMNDSTRTAFRNSIANWISFGGSLPHLTDYLHNRLKGLDIPQGWSPDKIKWATSRDRARLIAQTESTRVFTQGNLERWKTAGVQLVNFRTQNDRDVCLFCKLLGTLPPADPNKGWAVPPEWQAKYGKFILHPPSHPGCRCFLAPAQIVYGDEPEVIQPSDRGLKPTAVNDIPQAQGSQPQPLTYHVMRIFPSGRQDKIGRSSDREADAILNATRMQYEADNDPELIGLQYTVMDSHGMTTFTAPSSPRVALSDEDLDIE